MKEAESILAHYGVRGMRWGVRRSRAERAAARGLPVSEDAAAAKQVKAKVRSRKLGGTDALSNKELQTLVTRMNLEQQYGRLSSQKQKSAGAKIAGEILGNVAKQQATKLATDALTKQVAGALKKKQ